MTEKQCYRCKEIKPASDFTRLKSGKLRTYCKSCAYTYNVESRERRRAADPEKFHSYNRERQRVARENNKKMRVGLIFNNIRFHSKRRKRDLDFNMTRDTLFMVFETQDWKCKQTGIPFDMATGKGKRPFGPAVDRIDNERGYEISNIQIVCNVYNYAKNEFTDDDVMTFANALIANKLKNSNAISIANEPQQPGIVCDHQTANENKPDQSRVFHRMIFSSVASIADLVEKNILNK